MAASIEHLVHDGEAVAAAQVFVEVDVGGEDVASWLAMCPAAGASVAANSELLMVADFITNRGRAACGLRARGAIPSPGLIVKPSRPGLKRDLDRLPSPVVARATTRARAQRPRRSRSARRRTASESDAEAVLSRAANVSPRWMRSSCKWDRGSRTPSGVRPAPRCGSLRGNGRWTIPMKP